MYSPTLASVRFPTELTIHLHSSRTHSSRKSHLRLAYRTGSHLSPQGPTVLQHQLRRPLGAGHAGVDQEALRADPVSGQVEVVQARHPWTRSTGEAAVCGSWERADSLDTRQ